MMTFRQNFRTFYLYKNNSNKNFKSESHWTMFDISCKKAGNNWLWNYFI